MIISPQNRSQFSLARPLFRTSSTTAHDVYFVALVVLTLFHLWLASFLPPAEDELYYWAWSTHLQGSYFDHPPLVAYLIRLSTNVFGDSVFGIRFFACFASTAVLAGIGRLMPQKDLLTYLLASPIFFLGSVLMTPDVPLVFFWTFYALWVVRVNDKLGRWSLDPVSRVYQSSPVSWGAWISGGVLLGLGGLSKYTMLLAIPCTFLVFATRTRFRAWYVGFALHLLVAGLICLPVFFYNRAHDYLPLAFQWTHAMASSERASFFGFLGTQCLLIGGLPFLMLPWVLARTGFLLSDSRSQVCYYFFVPPMLFFLFKAMRGPLEANWALVAYVTFWPLAQRLFQQSSFKTLGRALVLISFLIPMAISFFLLVHALSPLAWIAPSKDRLGLMKARYALSRQFAGDFVTKHPGVRLYTTSYQWTSYLRFQKLEVNQIPWAGRASEFTLTEMVEPCRERSVLVWEPIGAARALGCFSRREILREYPLLVRDQRAETYALVRYRR